MKDKLFSVAYYLNFIVISLLFILVHIGIGMALFYFDDGLNFLWIFSYLTILGILLFIGIRFGFKKFILSAVILGVLCGDYCYFILYQYLGITSLGNRTLFQERKTLIG